MPTEWRCADVPPCTLVPHLSLVAIGHVPVCSPHTSAYRIFAQVTDSETNPFYECRNPGCCTFEEYPGCFHYRCGNLRYCCDPCLEADNKRLKREHNPDPLGGGGLLASR